VVGRRGLVAALEQRGLQTVAEFNIKITPKPIIEIKIKHRNQNEYIKIKHQNLNKFEE